MNMENRLRESHWQEPLFHITMPDSFRAERKTGSFRRKYIAFPAAVLTLIFTMLSGTTAYAAYQVHQYKTLAVFVEESVTEEQMENIGSQISRIEGISVRRYVSSDTAWEEFSGTYLDEEFAKEFDENPLAESYNYEVSVPLTMDTRSIVDEIRAIDGVRLVSRLAEL